jgi:AcrR family transcriptional regulator
MVTEESQPERKAYHHGDLKNALIQAGRELLERTGSEEFDLRTLSRTVGVSHAAPYRHFADKRALIYSIVEEGFKELAEALEKALASTVQKTEDRLQAVAVAYVRFARQNPALMREMFADWVAEDEASSVYQAGKAVFRMYSGIIRSGQEKGEVTDDDTDEVAGVFLSQIHGLAMLVIDGQTRHYAKEEAGIDQMVAFGIRTLYHGLHSRSQ